MNDSTFVVVLGFLQISENIWNIETIVFLPDEIFVYSETYISITTDKKKKLPDMFSIYFTWTMPVVR